MVELNSTSFGGLLPCWLWCLGCRLLLAGCALILLNKVPIVNVIHLKPAFSEEVFEKGSQV